MRRLLLSAVVAAGCVTWPCSSPAAEPWDRPGWELTFHDEFDGTALDASKWGKRYKWGEAVVNGELQAYVDDAFDVQGGTLTIVGTQRSGTYAGKTLDYRSGVLCSVHEQRFGYFEARLKMPLGRGFWPAFWLLGKRGAEGVNEIDIQEFLGHDPHTLYSTIHWGKSYGQGHHSANKVIKGPDYTQDFHVFGLEWDEHSVVWTLDGVEQLRHEGTGVPQVDMYVILNLAIGGDWPKAPDATTKFPGKYQIDYVRAYAKLAAPPAAASATPPAASVGDAGSASPSPSSASSAPASPVATAPRNGGCACRASRPIDAPLAPFAALGLLIGLSRRRRQR